MGGQNDPAISNAFPGIGFSPRFWQPNISFHGI
jgi:hypothetical protein